MNQKGFVNSILILIVIIFIGMASYFMLIGRQEPQIPFQITSPPDTLVQNLPTEDISTWKKFEGESEKYFFEIKYPPELSMIVEPKEKDISSSDTIFFLKKSREELDSIIGIYPLTEFISLGNIYAKTVDEFINLLRKGNNDTDFISEATITINGLDISYFVMKIKVPSQYKKGSQEQMYIAFIKDANNKWAFQIAGPNLPLNLTLEHFLNIISTFKILSIKEVSNILPKPGLSNMTTTSGSAQRDIGKIENLKNIQLILEIYHDRYKKYPQSLLDIKDMKELDSTGFHYSLKPNGQNYHMGITLEDVKNPVLTHDSDFNSLGAGWADGFDASSDTKKCSMNDRGVACYDILPIFEK